jgi:hypothetical protein
MSAETTVNIVFGVIASLSGLIAMVLGWAMWKLTRRASRCPGMFCGGMLIKGQTNIELLTNPSAVHTLGDVILLLGITHHPNLEAFEHS